MGRCRHKHTPEAGLRKIKPEFREEIRISAESCGDGECACEDGHPIEVIRLTDDRAFPGYYVEDCKVIPGEDLNANGVPLEQYRYKEQEETPVFTVHSGNVENVKTFLEEVIQTNGKVTNYEHKEQQRNN